jgi:hypothetical protein
MDIDNLDHLVSMEANNSPCKFSQLRPRGAAGINRYSFFRGSRSSGYQPIGEKPMTIDELRDLFCQGSSSDCSIEDFLAFTESSGENGYPNFRSIVGVGTLNNGIFSFSSASVSRLDR